VTGRVEDDELLLLHLGDSETLVGLVLFDYSSDKFLIVGGQLTVFVYLIEDSKWWLFKQVD
jgi:hypothetical protein